MRHCLKTFFFISLLLAAFVVSERSLQATPPHEIVASFAAPSPSGPASGPLVLGPDGYYWGTSQTGGAAAVGTIYKVKTDGSDWQIVLSFSGAGVVNRGSFPSGGLVSDGAGWFWGVTKAGGEGNAGTVYRVNAQTGALITVVEFSGDFSGNRGDSPCGELTGDGAGFLWGVTAGGGANFLGTVYKIEIATGAFSTVTELTGNSLANKGSRPLAGLISDGQGYLWGTTSTGGATDNGTIFKIEAATQTLTTVVEFTGNGVMNKGSQPAAALVSDGAGSFWGTTSAGGSLGLGTVFKIPAGAGVLETKVHFGGAVADLGAAPKSALVRQGADALWGVASLGGAANLGTLFKVDLGSGGLTTVLEFSGAGADNKGALPLAGLTNDASGILWGATFAGGVGDRGTVFAVDTGTGVLTTKAEFAERGADKGYNPNGRLVADNTTGLLWGTMAKGGANGYGTVFKLDPVTGEVTTVVDFTSNGSSNKGAYPTTALTSDGAGYFWGTTSGGGPAGHGTIFKINAATGVLSTVVLFDGNGPSTGSHPQGELLLDGSYFWGTAADGGSSNCGVVFRINVADGQLGSVIHFSDNGTVNKGAHPMGGLIKAGNYIIGTTSQGGPGGYGTVFRVDKDVTFNSVITVTMFTGGTGSYLGAAPYGRLYDLGSNVMLGATSGGGAGAFGSIFKVNVATASFSTVAQFTGTTGALTGSMPSASFAEGNTGEVWGTTTLGGNADAGTVFKYSISKDAVTSMIALTGSGTQANAGAQPGSGGLFKHTDGMLYGVTTSGGPNNGGTLFRIRLAPLYSLQAVSGISGAVATLNATVDANDNTNTKARFEWGLSQGALSNASSDVSVSGSSVAVTSALTGLQANTTYYYRLRTTFTSQNVVQYSAVLSFTTGPPNTNADLAGLYYSYTGSNSGYVWPVSPVFSAERLDYTGALPYFSKDIDLGVTKADAAASFTVRLSGAAVSFPTFVPVGQSVFSIEVTAQDGLTKKTYTVALTRADFSAGEGDLEFGTAGMIQTTTPGGSGYGRDIVVQPDGKIIQVGDSFGDRLLLVRYNQDGSMDATFGSQGIVSIVTTSRSYLCNSVALQTDGRIVVGGAVGSSSSTYDFLVARFNADGSLDSTFGNAGMLVTPVGVSKDEGSKVLVQPDGKIVLAGSCYVNNSDDFGVVRYLADGSLDSSFGNGGKVLTPFGNSHDRCHGLVLQKDGKLVAVGETFNGNTYDLAMVRYHTDGSLDGSFGTGGKVTRSVGTNHYTGDAILQNDGKILVGGYSGVGAPYLGITWRFNLDGSLDSGFGSSGRATVTWISSGVEGLALQPDGRVLLFSGTHIVRFLSNGIIDATFGTAGKIFIGASFIGRAMALQSDGAILVGSFNIYASPGQFVLQRFHNRLAPTVTPLPASDLTTSSAVLNGMVNANGAAAPGANVVFNFAEDVNGGNPSVQYAATPDTAAGTAPVLVQAVVNNLMPEKRYRYTLTATSAIGTTVSDVMTFITPSTNPDLSSLTLSSGSLSPVFDGAVTSYGAVVPNVVSSIAVTAVTVVPKTAQSDAQITVNGMAATPGSASDPVDLLVGSNVITVRVTAQDGVTQKTYTVTVTRALPPGGIDSHFGGIGPGATAGQVLTDVGGHALSNARDMVIQPDGKIVLAGLATFGAAFDPAFGNGGPVITQPAGQPDGEWHAIALQSDGKIVVAGRVNIYGTEAAVVARYLADGVLDSSFGQGGTRVASPGFGFATANSVAVQADGKIVVAGISGQGAFLLRYLANGATDSDFGVFGVAYAAISDASYISGQFWTNQLLIQSDGKILLAGEVSKNDNRDILLLRFNANGSPDDNFGTAGRVVTAIGSGDDGAYALALQSDGRIVVSGYSSNGHDWDFALVRYRTDGSLDDSFGSGGKVTTPMDGGYMDAVRSIIIQKDGRIVVGGFAGNSRRSFALARYLSDGSLDDTFGNHGKTLARFGDDSDSVVFRLALESDGRIVAAGPVSTETSKSFFGMMRFANSLAPTVSTGDATQFTATSVTLHGETLDLG